MTNANVLGQNKKFTLVSTVANAIMRLGFHTDILAANVVDGQLFTSILGYVDQADIFNIRD